MKIVVVGSSNTDMIVKVPRIPRPGETILGGRFSTAAGGKGANQAVAAARSGASVTFIARVGDDALGRQTLRTLKDEGIDLDYVRIDSVESSGVALILVDESGENSIAVASGANARLSPDDVGAAEGVIRDVDILLMQLETPIATVAAAAGIAERAGVKVIVNPAPACHLDDAFLETVSVITPNESELELLTGIPALDPGSVDRGALTLLNKGLDAVIVTMGSKGAYLKTQNEAMIIPAFPVEAVDTTAAGDVFNGALSVALAEGQSWANAIRYANAAAAISVTRLGAQPSVPRREDILRMLLR